MSTYHLPRQLYSLWLYSLWLYPPWQAFIAVSTEAPQLDQNYIHERVRAYAAGMQASK